MSAPTVAPAARLDELARGTDVDTALAFYDSLACVDVADVLGSWAGGEVPTGNPMDGLLTRFGWHGKRFGGPDDVDPLVFDRPGGGTIAVNPGLVPMGLMVQQVQVMGSAPVARVFRRSLRLVSTRRPTARLRMLEHRGKVSATMQYDAHPINDHFRAVDDDTLLGVMDLRGLEQPYVFYLRREA